MSNSQTAPSSSTNAYFVYGNWRNSTPVERDLEAQVDVAGNHEQYTPIQIPAPASVYAHDSRTTLPSSQPLFEEGTDPIDDFFGISHSRTGTRDSRHDAYMTPPPYEAESSDPPAYSEYPTLAMYLFKFGFRTCLSFLHGNRSELMFCLLDTVLPLFWVVGAFILFSTLQAPVEWETTKSQEERTLLLKELRRVEVKWARRCLIALSIFLSLAAIAITVVLVLHYRS